MSVVDRQKIDVIGLETVSGKVVLTVADDLDWSDENLHLTALQEKLNTYLSFIESGEVNEAFPESVGRRIVIAIVSKFALTEEGLKFLERARSIIEASGIELRHKVLRDEEQDNESHTSGLLDDPGVA